MTFASRLIERESLDEKEAVERRPTPTRAILSNRPNFPSRLRSSQSQPLTSLLPSSQTISEKSPASSSSSRCQAQEIDHRPSASSCRPLLSFPLPSCHHHRPLCPFSFFPLEGSSSQHVLREAQGAQGVVQGDCSAQLREFVSTFKHLSFLRFVSFEADLAGWCLGI